MIQKIHIENFKSLRAIDIELDRVNILVGGNNSGKTSILQAIQFGCSIAQSLKIIAGTKKINTTDFVRTIEAKELVYSPLKDVQALARGGKLKDSKKDEYNNILIIYKDDLEEEARIEIKKGTNRNIMASVNVNELSKRFGDLDKPMCMFVPGLAGIPYSEEFKSESIVRKAASKGDANEVIRNVLLLLSKDKQEWSRFQSEFQDIFPTMRIEVSFNEKIDDYIDVRIIEKKESDLKESNLPLDAAGTGVLQAIQILSYVSVYQPQILILDEPDAHLHPNNQRRILNYIFRLAEERDFQIIISTHSRHVVDLAKEVAKLMWVKNGEIQQEEEGNVRMLMEIGALDRGDLLKNGFVEYVFITEDSTDLEMTKTFLASNGFELNAVDIWSYNGCSKVDTAVTLANFIKEHAPGTKIILHRDRDYLSEEEIAKYTERVTAAVDYCFITRNLDIESYFVSAEHLQCVYGESMSDETAREIIESATLASKDKSVDKYIDARFMTLKADINRGAIKPASLTRECMTNYDNNVERYRHGKTTLKAMKNELQTRKYDISKLISPSNYAADAQLKEYREKTKVNEE